MEKCLLSIQKEAHIISCQGNEVKLYWQAARIENYKLIDSTR
jgi:hypothetical protein